MADPAQGRNAPALYQIEVKHLLMQFLFHPANGWKVYMDVEGGEAIPNLARS